MLFHLRRQLADLPRVGPTPLARAGESRCPLRTSFHRLQRYLVRVEAAEKTRATTALQAVHCWPRMWFHLLRLLVEARALRGRVMEPEVRDSADNSMLAQSLLLLLVGAAE